MASDSPTVLMTADAVGGVWVYALELARQLGPRGWRVALATMGRPPTDRQRRESARISGLELRASDLRLEWMSDPWDDLERAGEWLLRLEEEYHPDVVHLNGYVHGALPWSAPVLVVGHSCVCSWWRAVKGVQAPTAWDRYRAAVRAGLLAADLVVAPSRAMLASLEREYGRLPHSRVIANGRTTGSFRPGRKEPLILGVGRVWDEAKNLLALARVAQELPWPVYLAGDTTHPEGGCVSASPARCLGGLPAEELSDWYGTASICALPSLYEPFGLSALEAGLAGCALVLGDIPSLREVWGDAALFVAPDDQALSGALRRLIGDAALRADLSRRARQRALSYSPERMVAGYLDAYGFVGRQRWRLRTPQVVRS